MKLLKRGIYVAEKVIVAISLMACFGIVGDMNRNGFITLEDYRTVILYCLILGFLIGISIGIFDIDRLDIKLAYAIHFVIGYVLMVVVEGVLLHGSILPTSQPRSYLFKLFWYFVAYTAISLIEYFKSKWEIDRMNKKINEIKGN